MNGQASPVDADATFEYAPEEIGEQILEFEVSAAKASAKARAYMDVVKNIVVTSCVEGCFTIDGAGEHNVEGETVTLKLVNDELFNFEVAGWYDTSGSSCPARRPMRSHSCATASPASRSGSSPGL